LKVRKETRQLARALLRASFTDGQLDKGRISSVVQSLTSKKPRDYIKVLEDYKNLLRLELGKRHARIEIASELDDGTRSKILATLEKKYGNDLTTEFVNNPALLGGVRIRVGSDVWDGSVRNRLQRLEQQL
jgi:F-type H+-transporting ATPase subunit delta